MKNLVKGVISLSLFLSACITSNAQRPTIKEPDMNRPLLFQNFPNKISCRINELSGLFESAVGATVSFSFTDNLSFRGTITSAASEPDNKLQSIVVRSANFPGAVLSFSRVSKEDKTVTYVGSILSFQHGDAYEISLENGQYYFIKKGYYDLVNE